MQKTDLNVSPYYDDFDTTDNFHRVLFRPGFAVQARELTQLQSILQYQLAQPHTDTPRRNGLRTQGVRSVRSVKRGMCHSIFDTRH